MRIGILTDYGQTDATYAALDLASLFSDWGYELAIYAWSRASVSVSARWDPVVRRCGDLNSFVRGTDVLIWLSCGDEEYLQRCRKHGIRCYLVPSWQDLTETHREIYAQYHGILAPFKAAARVLRDQYGLPQVFDCPWSPERAAFTRAAGSENGRVKLLVPAEGRRADTVPENVCDYLRRLLLELPQLDVTLLVSGWNARARSRLSQLCKEFPDRVSRQRMPLYEEFTTFAFRHDAVFFASLSESFGGMALRCLHAGLPVISWEIAPFSEFVRSGRNGLLIPAATKRRPEGYVCVDKANGDAAVSALHSALGDRDRLRTLQSQTKGGLDRRRQVFERVWMALLTTT